MQHQKKTYNDLFPNTCPLCGSTKGKGKQIKPTAILTADWHLRDTQPVCRTDNFWEAQWKKVQYVLNLQNEHKCPIIHAGDFFHTWKTSPYLLSKTMEHMDSKYPFLTVYGNHDLPQHNLELAHKSGLHTLCMAGKLITLPGGPLGAIFPRKFQYIKALLYATYSRMQTKHPGRVAQHHRQNRYLKIPTIQTYCNEVTIIHRLWYNTKTGC